MSRREMLRWCGRGLALAPFASVLVHAQDQMPLLQNPGGGSLRASEEELLDEVQQAMYQFFWNETSPATGQIKDRAFVNGNDSRTVSSIAATGFGLTSLCIGDARGYGRPEEIVERVRVTLRFLYNDMPNVHGFYYHFVDMNTGERYNHCELSPIDTSILLCGVLTARQYFQDDKEIHELATKIYNRVEWPWMLNGGKTFAKGWNPENGFFRARWDTYCELMMMYLLAMGSPTHRIPAESWKAWSRPLITYGGLTFISGNDPIFTHQYSHAWFDFRNKRDSFADYFENSVLATRAHKQFCLDSKAQFNAFSEDLWGITSSDSKKGYTVWGALPPQAPLVESVVPCASGGSIAFLCSDCIHVMQTIRENYSDKAWGRYGFVDAFNPLIDWYDTDVLGIDLGITMLMAENCRTSLVWNTFMKNPEAQIAMKRAGFERI
jgi:hypothetical protein